MCLAYVLSLLYRFWYAKIVEFIKFTTAPRYLTLPTTREQQFNYMLKDDVRIRDEMTHISVLFTCCRHTCALLPPRRSCCIL